MRSLPPPFPDRIRRRTTRRRRRPAVLWLAAPLLLLVLPMWRVQGVEHTGTAALPTCVAQSLGLLEGSPVLLLDLEWIRSLVEVWPATEAVEVQLELPGTLHVTIRRAEVRASVLVGRSWHGVAASGRLIGSVTNPRPPCIEGLPLRSEALHRALAVSRRLESSSGARVLAVRQLMPQDFEVTLAVADTAGGEAVIHVASRTTVAESWWCERVRSGDVPSLRADLRFEDRLTLGGAS